jgi:uncharacterized Tic20 family protein
MAETNETSQPAEVSQEARMCGMLCHLLGLFASFIGALIAWLIMREKDPFVDNQGKEALNFQITVFIASFAVWFAAGFVGTLLRCRIFITPFLFAMAVLVANITFSITACIKASGGEAYRYLVSIRFIK